MTESVLLGLASIVVLGIGAQWLAWRVRVPSILLLLLVGFLAGPVTGLLDPDALLGEALISPLVSLSVGIILFEGGLSLRLAELREIGKTVRNLITLGVLITWTLTAVAAYYLAGFNLALSILIGALLVVTGPTVIVPLLRHIRPTGRIGATARWEGIINDPIGAILSILVLETIVLLHQSVGAGETATGLGEAMGQAVEGLFLIFFVSVGVSIIGALILVLLLHRRLVPDYLQNSVALMIVVGVFALADELQAESGLLATTLMGIAMANQRFVTLQRIAAFKEDLQVLLIGSLFILLSARLDPSTLRFLDTRSLLFLAALILVVRPVTVFCASLGAELTWKEQAFLMWLAPRGIVAAAIASLFSFRLQDVYPEQATAFVALTFLVIVGTVTLYGLTITPLARWLGLAQPNPQGVLFVGAHAWVRKVARVLQDQDVKVLLADTNAYHVRQARRKDLPVQHANVLSERAMNDLELGGLGYLLALTPNDETNALAALHFADVFGSTNVYQLSTRSEKEPDAESEFPQHLRGRPLFGGEETYTSLAERFENGAAVEAMALTDDFTYETFRSEYGPEALPLFLISASGTVEVYSEEEGFVPQKGQMLVALVPPATGD